MKKWMNQALSALAALAVVLLIAGAIGGCVAVKWNVYHQRFPNASWWTFLFK